MSNRTSPAPHCPPRLSSPSRGQRYCVSRFQLPLPAWSLTPPSYKFRQASDFWYLTGFDEPDAAVILGPSPHLLSCNLTHLPPIRKDQLRKRLQNVSLLVRLKPREGKVGRCEVGNFPLQQCAHVHNPQLGQPSRMPRRTSLSTNHFPFTPCREHYVRFSPLPTTFMPTFSTPSREGTLRGQS